MKRWAALLGSAALLPAAGCGSKEPPSIAILTPVKGPVGTVVTLEGRGLRGTSSVTFGGRPALFRQISDVEVMATVPFRAISGSVGLTASAGSTKTFVHFLVAGAPLPGNGRIAPGVVPAVTAIYPVAAPPGAIVDIRGDGIRRVREVRFGHASAVFRIVDGSDLRAVVPPRAQSGPISLVSELGVGPSSESFRVLPLR